MLPDELIVAFLSGTVFQFSENATKSVAEILAKDSEDESLRRYKESLLGTCIFYLINLLWQIPHSCSDSEQSQRADV